MFNTILLFYTRRIKIDFDNPKPYYESFEDLFKTKKQLRRERLIRKQIRLEKIKKKIAAELWARLDKLKEKKRLKEEKEQLKLKLAEEKRLSKLEKIKIKKNEQ